MKVGELKDYLEQFDDDAEVLFVSQPSWPFEYSIGNVVQRSDVEEVDEENSEKSKEDCMIVEGTQLRYASKDYWE